MTALITGASSGIGRDMAIYLSSLGYDLILVARRKEKLEELKQILKTDVQIIDVDLSVRKNAIGLCDSCGDVDILINNAGFGVFGELVKSDLSRELDMIDVNISALHILTKKFLQRETPPKHILNVASSAAFLPGPLMSGYYASKAYVLRFSQAVKRELKGKKVKISVLCPGPVDTEFNNVAGVHFAIKACKCKEVALYAIDNMLKGKFLIIPSFFMGCCYYLSRIAPTSLLLDISYKIQNGKRK